MQAIATLFDDPKAVSKQDRPKNRFYTYLVAPAGPVTTVTGPDGETSLSLKARLTRGDGSSRTMAMRIANTERSPDMVSRVTSLFMKKAPVRMVVEIDRLVRDGRLTVEAIAESLLEPKRAAPEAQLSFL